MMFRSEAYVFVALCILGITCGSKVQFKNLLDGAVQQFSSYTDNERQEFVDAISKLIVREIKQKASKAVALQDEYQRLRYGLNYGIKAIATISLEGGVTSKPTFTFVNATIENYASNHIEFNTRVSFDSLRLSYSECKLNISGTRQNGMLSANVENFEGVFSTLLDFKESGWTWLRRSRTVLGNVRATTNPTVELGLPEDSRDMFAIYANMVHPEDLQEVFRRQMIHVFDVVILDHVDQLYNYLKAL